MKPGRSMPEALIPSTSVQLRAAGDKGAQQTGGGGRGGKQRAQQAGPPCRPRHAGALHREPAAPLSQPSAAALSPSAAALAPDAVDPLHDQYFRAGEVAPHPRDLHQRVVLKVGVKVLCAYAWEQAVRSQGGVGELARVGRALLWGREGTRGRRRPARRRTQPQLPRALLLPLPATHQDVARLLHIVQLLQQLLPAMAGRQR